MGYGRRKMAPPATVRTDGRTVQRSISLGSLRRWRTPSLAADGHRKFSDDSIDDDVIIPADIVAQLESDMLHGNLKRDSFRSRSATKHFVTNPIFDEKQES